MTAVVLDASALLAMLRGEPGGKKVEGALGDARMSVVNMAEVASHYHRLGMPAELVEQMLRPLPITLVPADAELCCTEKHTNQNSEASQINAMNNATGGRSL